MILLSRVLSVFDSRNDFINSSLGVCLSVLKSVSASLRVQSEGLMPSFLLPLVAQGPLLPMFLSELMLRDCAVKAKRGRSSKGTPCALQLLIIGHFLWCLGLLPEDMSRPEVKRRVPHSCFRSCT